MIEIYHLSNEVELSSDAFLALESLLPDKFIGSFQRYLRWQDRQAGLFGKLLVRQLLIDKGYSPNLLASYHIDTYGRPEIDAPIDFNISHTDGRVIAALTDAPKIGIDIERIRSIDPKEFYRVFTDEEVVYIGSGDNYQLRFFEIWTKKEAVMKADGRGFYLDAAKISTLEKPVRIEEST